MCYQVSIIPRDVLYFRDARPLGGTADGNGAQWPLPTVWHSAVLSAFHRTFSEQEIGLFAKRHEHARRGDRNFDRLKRTKAVFGGLKTLGPFPKKDGKIYFPVPADLIPDGDVPAQLLPCEIPADALGNLPAPLKYVLWKNAKPTKAEPWQWISAEGLADYLAGAKPETLKPHLAKNSDFFDTEARPGIALSPETGVVSDGKFYSAEYLRLKPGVEMAVSVDALSVGRNGTTDLWEKFCGEKSRNALIFGGQRGVIRTEELRKGKIRLPENADFSGKRLKWTLLSPALFDAGWRPGFVDAKTGEVQLKSVPARAAGESRASWRQRCAGAARIGATLVAARIGKPLLASGWKINSDENAKNSGNDGGGAPKASRLFVPAGSVYYFECADEASARMLCASLHGNVKSDRFGEQGCGLGVCSAWELSEETF